MNENKLYGRAVLPVVIWGFWTIGAFVCIFAAGWYFCFFTIALSYGLYMLYHRQPRGLLILSSACIFAIALFSLIDPKNAVVYLALFVWLPPLTFFMTHRQINYFVPGRRGGAEDLSWLNSYNAEPPRSFHGSLGEPYCSIGCLGSAGRYASSAILQNQDGVCGFCRKPVKASINGAAGCAVIPYEGITLFVCPDCANKAKTYMEDYHKCCMCQKAIENGSMR